MVLRGFEAYIKICFFLNAGANVLDLFQNETFGILHFNYIIFRWWHDLAVCRSLEALRT